MRGFGPKFHRLQKNTPTSMIFLESPKKYTAHKIIKNGTYTKMNCHLTEDCPFCISQDGPPQNGLYAIALMTDARLHYFDITAELFRVMRNSAREFCHNNSVRFDSMSTFIKNKLVIITKIFSNGEFAKYDVGYKTIGSDQMKKLENKFYNNGKPVDALQTMIDDLDELVRPGTYEEDKEFMYGDR